MQTRTRTEPVHRSGAGPMAERLTQLKELFPEAFVEGRIQWDAAGSVGVAGVVGAGSVGESLQAAAKTTPSRMRRWANTNRWGITEWAGVCLINKSEADDEEHSKEVIKTGS